MPQTYAPPPAVLERTRLAIGCVILSALFWAVRGALLLLPQSHPYRIFTNDRTQVHLDLLEATCAAKKQQGRPLPVLANVAMLYLVFDSVSRRLPGPVDLVPHLNRLDDHVRLIDRLSELLVALPL